MGALLPQLQRSRTVLCRRKYVSLAIEGKSTPGREVAKGSLCRGLNCGMRAGSGALGEWRHVCLRHKMLEDRGVSSIVQVDWPRAGDELERAARWPRMDLFLEEPGENFQ